MPLKPGTEKLSDEEIIARYRSEGDAGYIGVLYKRYMHLVLGVCMKYLQDEDESKDAVMQIFEKLLTDLRKYEIGAFKAWLHTVTRNHCFLHLRRNKKEISRVDPYIMEKQTAKHQEESVSMDGQAHEQRLQDMEQALERLEPHQRQCIELFYLQQKSYTEVAALTGFNMNQVKSYIQNGKRNLKIMLGKNG